MRNRLVFGFVFLLGIQAATGSTRVFIQNNTGRTLSIGPRSFSSSADHSHRLSRDRWQWGARSVPPYTRREIVNIPRSGGFAYQNNRFYAWSQGVSTGGQTLTLKQRVDGTTFSHDLGFLAGPGNTLYDVGDIDTPRWHQWGSIEVVYQSFAGPFIEYIEYIFNEDPPLPSNDTNVLNVLAYNVQMFPEAAKPFSGQGSRAAAMRRRQHLLNYDVVVLSELFNNGVRQDIMDGLRDDWNARHGSGSFYRTAYMHRGGFKQDGGVVIASRFPIVEQGRIFYNDCATSDCLSAKGVVYAKISKRGRRYNVFGSHTQADYPSDGEFYPAIRAAQFRQMKAFIDSKNIDWHEPVIVAGDLNVDRYDQTEFDSMLGILSASFPNPLGHPFTSDPTLNTFNGGSRRTYLDYVLYSDEHIRPVDASVETRVLRSRFKWNTSWRAAFEDRHFDLSDHFAVFGRLEFGPPTMEVFGLNVDGDLINVHIEHESHTPGALVDARNLTRELGPIGPSLRLQGEPVAVTQRRRLTPTIDVFGMSANSFGDLIHYYWNPTNGWGAENLTTNAMHKIYGKVVVVAQERNGIPAIEVFGVGAYSHLIHYHWNQQSGWASENLTTDYPGRTGLTISSDLAAVEQTRNDIPAVDVFGHNQAGELIHYYWSLQAAGRWRAENLTATARNSTSANASYFRPVAVAQTRKGIAAVDVFTVSSSNLELIHYYWSQQAGGQWAAENLTRAAGGERILSEPVVVTQTRRGIETLDVFGLGVTYPEARWGENLDPRESGELVHYYWSRYPGGWGAESFIRDYAGINSAHRVYSGLAVIPQNRRGVNAVDVFGGGSSSGGHLLHYFWSQQAGGSWRAEDLTALQWHNPNMAGRPAVLGQYRYGSPTVDVFARGSSGHLIRYYWSMVPGGWRNQGGQPWDRLGTHQLQSDPVVIDPHGREAQPR